MRGPAPSRALAATSEVFADVVQVLRTCDLVLGSVSVGLACLATFAAMTGRASAALIWCLPVVNLAWSRIARNSGRFALFEVLRTGLNLPLVFQLYASKDGYFAEFWFPAEVMVVGQSVLWGCLTGRALGGQLVTSVLAGAILAAGVYSSGGVEWLTIRVVLGIGITGVVLSFVSGRLGRSLRQALMQRDEAEDHEQRLELAFIDLAATQVKLDAVLQCAPGFIVAVDRDCKVEFVNRVASPLGKSAEIGTSVFELVAPEGRQRLSLALRAVLGNGVPEDIETRQVEPDGSQKWYSTHIGAMRGGPEIIGAVLVVQDVSHLKRAQAKLVGTQRMAAVGTLAAGVAHEINTPIQFVNDSTHFLRDATRDLFVVIEALQTVKRLAEADTCTPALAAAVASASQTQATADLEYLIENVPLAFETCLEGLARVTGIVRAMKEFAHPSQKEMGAADLNHAIQSTLTIACNEYKYVADLVTHLAELPPIVCHLNDVNQVVLNLVVNAAHAIADAVRGTTKRGVITVETRRAGDEVVISVRDTGTGIPDAVKGRVFEPFFTTKEVGKGTGQGLALAWSLVKEKHGGEISFETKLGEGTTFYVRLPVSGKPSGGPLGELPRWEQAPAALLAAPT